MTTVFVSSLEFYAYHGVTDEERTIGHRYVVDLEMEVASDAEISDRVAQSVDYGEAASLVVEIGTKEQYRTVEKLAATIAEVLFLRFSRIQQVSVRVAKRLPPAPIVASEAGIRIVRTRNDRP